MISNHISKNSARVRLHFGQNLYMWMLIWITLLQIEITSLALMHLLFYNNFYFHLIFYNVNSKITTLKIKSHKYFFENNISGIRMGTLLWRSASNPSQIRVAKFFKITSKWFRNQWVWLHIVFFKKQGFFIGFRGYYMCDLKSQKITQWFRYNEIIIILKIPSICRSPFEFTLTTEMKKAIYPSDILRVFDFTSDICIPAFVCR